LTGPFEEEEERMSTASDVVQVEATDPKNRGFSEGGQGEVGAAPGDLRFNRICFLLELEYFAPLFL